MSFYEGSPRVKSPVAVCCYGGLVIFSIRIRPWLFPGGSPLTAHRQIDPEPFWEVANAGLCVHAVPRRHFLSAMSMNPARILCDLDHAMQEKAVFGAVRATVEIVNRD